MADAAREGRGTTNRGTAAVPSGKLRAVAGERAISQRATQENLGNSGTFLGNESRNGVMYARYRAGIGTWVSASLAQQGYDRVYGKDSAYGAYLGVVLTPDGQPLKSPDRIVPGQEYLIPVRTFVSFEDQPVTGYRTPQTIVGTELWKQDPTERWLKDRLVLLRDMPYVSFELKGPTPPSRVPRDAVAYWLGLHKREIIKAESDWHVSRLAIAGIIAWEALENPQGASIGIPRGKDVGPGKIHLKGDSGQISWPDVVELTGRKKELTPTMRRIRLSTPEGAIDYIGAICDFIATVAEARGWNIRNHPEILGQIFHSRSAERWLDFMKTKPENAPFTIVPGTMGKWIDDNRGYLEKAVGPPELW